MRIIFFITACLLLNACAAAKQWSGAYVGEIVTQEEDYIKVRGHFYVDPFNTSEHASARLNNKVAPVAANYCSTKSKYAYKDATRYEDAYYSICTFKCATEDELPFKTSNIRGDRNSFFWTNC